MFDIQGTEAQRCALARASLSWSAKASWVRSDQANLGALALHVSGDPKIRDLYKQSTSMSIYVYMSNYMSICLYVYMSVCLRVCVSACLCVCVSVCLCVCVCALASIYLYIAYFEESPFGSRMLGFYVNLQDYPKVSSLTNMIHDS